MNKITILSILSTLALQTLSYPLQVGDGGSYVDGGDGGSGDNGDGGSGGVDPLVDSNTKYVDNYSTVIPQNNCGYSNTVFDTSLNTFASNDTVWFYYGDSDSNCGAPNGNSCNGYMYMTGNYGEHFGYVPYSVWYTFKNVADTWFITLRFNYNNGQTSIVDTVACDGYEHLSTLNRCMFDENLYSFEFYNFYQFDFFTRCSYDTDLDTMAFTLDQQSRTCVGDGNVNTNRFQLATFQDWCPTDTVVITDESEFCPGCVQTTTTEVVPTSTEVPCETTEVPVPPPPAKPACLSCGSGDNITVNVNINNKNKNVV